MSFFRTMFNKKGEEIPDPTPVSIDTGIKKPLTINEMIRKLVKDESFRASLEAKGIETFEEADDFEIGDDYDPSSPYEEHFDPAHPFIGARVGEVKGLMVEEKPLSDKHRAALDASSRPKQAPKPQKLDKEVKNDESVS